MITIKLGSTVRDLVTGFTGIAIQRLEQLNGNVQIAIQPKATDGASYPDSIFIDQHMIEVVDEGVSARITEPVETAIVVGQKVRDKATGLKGIAINKGIYMNGCVSFWVEPKLEKTELGQTSPGAGWIDHARLEVVSEGVREEVKPAEPASTGFRPGGPAQKAMPRF